MTNKNEYLRAISLLNHWANAYYVLANPIATDDEYDVLYREVKLFEEKNPDLISLTSPTQTINEGLVSGFESEHHEEKMFSLNDVFNENEFLSWYKNLSSSLHAEPELYVEKKFDGASLNLKYINGVLTTAITRGNGEVGDIVTLHAAYIAGIPLFLPEAIAKSIDMIEVRGEVVIFNSDFEEIQEQLISEGKEPFKNSRNAAAGVLHSLNPADCKKRKLTFLPYSVGATSKEVVLPRKQIDIADFLVSLGFLESEDRRHCATPAQVISYFHEIMDKRNNLSMRIDGIVVKVNSINEQKVVGFNNKFPKWACAWKPPAEEKSTILESVEITVGKNGQITPVGNIKATQFNDSIVERVTFSNFDKVEEYDLHIGDTVIIIKSGDIIPKLIGVIKDRRPLGAQKILVPTSCPSCGSKIEKTTNKDGSDGVVRVCTGSSCPAKAEGLLTYIISKPVLNVDGMGEKTAIQLVNMYKVNDVLDLLKVSVEQFQSLDGFARKKAEKSFNSVQSIIGNISFDKILVLFNIDGLGKSISKELAIEYGENVFDPLVVKNITMHGINSDIFEQLSIYLENNIDYVKQLIDVLNPTPVKVVESEWTSNDINHDGKYSGQTICITGTLDHPRSHYASIIESEGGTFMDKVKKGVDILILGDKVGKIKIEKAEKMGIKCIPFRDFF